MKKKYVIIVAGGKGLRMGGELPKQFMLLAGRPVLVHTIEAFYNYDPDINIIVVLPEDQRVYWSQVCKVYNVTIQHQVVNGGETRFHSVKNGLQLVDEDTVVAVHDGVRPLVSSELIAKVYEIAESEKGAYPVIPLVDSLRKYVSPKGKSRPVDRSKYCLVQTPQTFLSNVLKYAYKQEYKEKFTDDVSVVEDVKNCVPVMIEGTQKNIKITTPIDLKIAEALIKCRI